MQSGEYTVKQLENMVSAMECMGFSVDITGVNDNAEYVFEGGKLVGSGKFRKILTPTDKCCIECTAQQAFCVTARCVMCGGEKYYIVARQKTELPQYNIDEIYTDELTGLYNRRYLKEKIGSMLKCADDGGSYTVAMIDVDGFKSINDTFGHRTGDSVLKELSRRLKNIFSCYNNNFVSRYAGDEFVVVMKDFSSETVKKCISGVLTSVSDTPFKACPLQRITVSAGVIDVCDLEYKTPELLLDTMDDRLYRAKGLGKNRYIYKN